MNLESQVCSLKLARRLKELNVKQDSLFYWFDMEIHKYLFCKYYEQYSKFVDLDIKDGFSAFSIAELGEILPDSLCIKGEHPNFFIAKGTQEENKFTVGYSTMETSITPFFTEYNEANARAKTLIYLIENQLFTPEWRKQWME